MGARRIRLLAEAAFRAALSRKYPLASLSGLPANVLTRTEQACDHFAWLYETHKAIDRELYIRASVLMQDVHLLLDDSSTEAGEEAAMIAGPENDNDEEDYSGTIDTNDPDGNETA